MKLIPVFCLLVTAAVLAQPAGFEVGEILIVNTSGLNSTYSEAIKELMTDASTTWARNQGGVAFGRFYADRGKEEGGTMLVCSIKSIEERKNFPDGSPFDGSKSAVVANPKSFTEYRLVGAPSVKSLPIAGILGMHYIKVKKEQAIAFERFVADKLNPVLSQLFPDMQMLYYKATAGQYIGSYVTIWTIKSVEARDQYWPANKPETEALKAGYAKHTALAKELEKYLVKGSYLERGKGAAAIFESLEWTDYVLQ